MDLKQLALDANISENEYAGREADVELLTRRNSANSEDKEGYGIRFNDHGNVMIAKDSAEMKALYNSFANDVDTYAFNIPSNGVLQFATTVFNNKFIEQVLKVTTSREVLTPWQQGTFGITNIFVPTISYGGGSSLYSDYSGEGQSSINVNQVPRGTVILQRTLQYGDLVQAMMSMGKIDYVGQLRTGMTKLTNLDINSINLFGFSGLNVFGLLNDPNLLPVLPSPTTGTGGSSLWIDKDFAKIILDFQTMFQEVINNAGGHVDYQKYGCTLLLPTAAQIALTYVNSFGITVESYLAQTFPKMRIVTVPQYNGTGDPIGSEEPNFVQLIFDQIDGQEVAYELFTSPWNSHGVVRQPSAYVEKISYQVSGAFIALPMGVVTMSGV